MIGRPVLVAAGSGAGGAYCTVESAPPHPPSIVADAATTPPAASVRSRSRRVDRDRSIMWSVT
jgi:hypothetical protein